MTLNICLFGAGRIAQTHAENIQAQSNTKLLYVVDPDESKGKTFADKYNCTYKTRPEEVFKDSSIDAICIASSSSTHADIILETANLGLPIFCEKPIDLCQERILTCQSALQKNGNRFLLGFNRRFDPDYISLKDQLNSGAIGSIEQLNLIARDHPLPPISYLKTSGGIFHDMTIHDFDLARWLMGEEFSTVYATGSCLINKELEEFGDVDTATIILTTLSGKQCTITNSRRTTFGYDQRIEAFGSQGMLQIENKSAVNLKKFVEAGVIHANPLPSFPQRFKQAFTNEISHFVHEVCEGQKSKVSIEDGLKATIIADCARESLAIGSPVEIASTVLH